MTPRARRSAQAGFTLLELLVALAVLGLLMVGLTQGVRTGLALRQAQIHRLGETAELDATMRFLRLLLSRIPNVAAGGRVVATANGGLFRGEPERIGFVGELPTGFGTTRRAELTLELQRGALILSWTPHRHEQPAAPSQPLPAPQQTELLRGVARLDLAYWGAPGPGRPANWETQWQSPAAPELIRLRLIFAKGDARRWPDLIAAPMP